MEHDSLTGNGPVHRLVLRRAMVTMDSIEGDPATINEQHCRGETPLMIAVQRQYTFILRSLLALKPALNCQDIDGNTALHHAVHSQDRVSIDALLKGKPDPNIRNNEGKTCLHVAVQFGNCIVVRSLLTKAVAIDINVVATDGSTPLILAVKYQHIKIATELIKLNVDVTVTDDNDNSALFWATALSNTALIHVVASQSMMNHANKEGLTPLALAAKFGEAKRSRHSSVAGQTSARPTKMETRLSI